MVQITLAYKYVLIVAMMAQVNYYTPRMHLRIDVPVRDEDIRFLYVSEPIIVKDFQDYGGRIQVKNYSFTFVGDKRFNIYNVDEYGRQSLGIPRGPDESIRSALERASRMKYVVSTNDVYRMATNWLLALDVDLEKLEPEYSPRLIAVFHSDRGLVPAPVLTVAWDSPSLGPSGVAVGLSAVTGDLLTLQDGRLTRVAGFGTFSKRSDPLIRDLKKLLEISDEQFLKYTEQERKELVLRFAGLPGPWTNSPPVISDKLLKRQDDRTRESGN